MIIRRLAFCLSLLIAATTPPHAQAGDEWDPTFSASTPFWKLPPALLSTFAVLYLDEACVPVAFVLPSNDSCQLREDALNVYSKIDENWRFRLTAMPDSLVAACMKDAPFHPLTVVTGPPDACTSSEGNAMPTPTGNALCQIDLAKIKYTVFLDHDMRQFLVMRDAGARAIAPQTVPAKNIARYHGPGQTCVNPTPYDPCPPPSKPTLVKPSSCVCKR